MKNVLQRLEQLAEKKAEALEIQNYDKYNPLYDIAIQFFRKKGKDVLLYGGLAIHELMPKNLKIYRKKTLPDIDVFAVNGKKIAYELVNVFREKGYELATVTEALHENTVKVFVQGMQVADVTSVTPRAFRRLSENREIGPMGIHIVNVQFLRMSLHLMLSHSNDAHRWKKVYERLVRFHKVFPPRLCTPPKVASSPGTVKSMPHSAIYEEVRDKVYAYVKKNGMVLLGMKEAHAMLGVEETDPIYHKVPGIQILTSLPVDEVAEQIVALFPHLFLRMSKVYEEDVFVGTHVFVQYKSAKWIAIFFADSCMSFNQVAGYKIATIHTMLQMYMSMMLSPHPHFTGMLDSLEHMTCALSLLQQKTATSRKKLLQQFVLDCYGVQQGMATLRRDRLMRILRGGAV